MPVNMKVYSWTIMSLINAQDMGLAPTDDEKESRLNKSMDVSTCTSFLYEM